MSVETKPRFKLKIDRSKWGTKRLLNSAGEMCAMGFIGRAIGIPDEHMLDIGMPDLSYEEDRKKWGEIGLVACTQNGPKVAKACENIANCNDSYRWLNELGENRVKSVLAEYGFDVEFV